MALVASMVPAAAAAGVTVEAVTRAVAVTAQDRAELSQSPQL